MSTEDVGNWIMSLDYFRSFENFGCDLCETMIANNRNYFGPWKTYGSFFEVIMAMDSCTTCNFKSFVLIKIQLSMNRALMAHVRLPADESHALCWVRGVENIKCLFRAMRFESRHPTMRLLDSLYENIVVGPASRFDLNRYNECIVCLVDFMLTDTVSKFLRCGHFFHSTCIGNWAHCNMFKLTCPVCRDECKQLVIREVLGV